MFDREYASDLECANDPAADLVVDFDLDHDHACFHGTAAYGLSGGKMSSSDLGTGSLTDGNVGSVDTGQELLLDESSGCGRPR